MSKFKCPYCDESFTSYRGLANHAIKNHKEVDKVKLAVDFYHNGIHPTCKCGCGENLNFLARLKDTGYFGDYIRGHIARIKNNWGHNDKAIQNSANTRRDQYKAGEREVWNKGLTKETDERVKGYGAHGSETINSNPNTLQYRSDTMKRQWEGGSLEIRYGRDSANWKGGTSTINQMVRGNDRMYKEWIYPILKESNFKCNKCDSTKNLEVHHDGETMAEILSKFVDKDREYTWEEKQDIMNEVIDYHSKCRVSGEVLCKYCHMELHPSYNL